MAHGLAKFAAQDLIDTARSAIDLLEKALGSGTSDANQDAFREALQIALENQIKIAETLDLVKIEFDKFEDGLSKIM